MKKSKKIITIILGIIVIIYIIYAICLLIINPTDTYIIKQGEISEEEEGIGYVIREETIIKGDDYKNGIYSIVSEGEKVGKGDSVFRYYSNEEKQTTEKIKELDYQIQEELEKLKKEEKITTSADIKAIENQIETEIVDIKKLNNIQEIAEYKTNIDNLISKKIAFIGSNVENSNVKQLIAQREQYENSLKNGAKYISAPIGGIVSYRVDGLEEQLTEENFSNITEEKLENIEIRTGQIISSSNECGKIIDNFKCYIAVVMDSDKSKEVKLGDKVKIRIAKKQEVDAEVSQINEQSGKRVIIFRLNEITEELINYRKIAIDVIWWKKTGLKVPNQALIEENGLYYIIRNKSGIETKMLIKIEGQTERYSIISSYTLKDLEEIGYNEKEIKNYKKINNYDEILINKK